MKNTKEKIKKLLALAKSDNPFEAKRAQTQANALIKRQNDQPLLFDMSTTPTKTLIDGPEINQSDFNLLNSVCASTGTKLALQVIGLDYQPIYIGHTQDVDQAVDLFDSIRSQLTLLTDKLKTHYTSTQIECYSMGFSNSTNTQLNNKFGFQPPDSKTIETANQHYSAIHCHTQTRIKPYNTKSLTPDRKALAHTGFRAGQKVALSRLIEGCEL